jgi:imidazolonepropionase-like amidohydrolase
MTNLQAIQTATTAAAELLGQSHKIGEIKPGAFADLIALKGNTAEDIRVLEDVKWAEKDSAVKK